MALDLLLPNGMLAQIDPVDEDLASRRWRAFFHEGYRRGWVACRDHFHSPGKRKRIYLHRAVALRIAFIPPSLMFVRPIDGNWLNCRRNNLYVYEMGRGARKAVSTADHAPANPDD